MVFPLLVASLALGWTHFALAASGGGTGGGKIYFSSAGLSYTMNSDGSGKNPLPANVGGEPSRALHGGHRWFLQSREIVGEFYPGGTLRHELFAVRGDGDEAFTKQLTDQPDLERVGGLGNTRWANDATLGTLDGVISWIARRWDQTTGVVLEGGIYAEEIVFDASGNVMGLAAEPVAPLIPAPLVNTGNPAGPEADIRDHDWAPNGLEIVFGHYSKSELRIVNLSGVSRLLLLDPTGSLTQPVWSPDNKKIAFASSGGIESINIDGTKRKKLQSNTPWTSIYLPIWSPTGTHLVYQFLDRRGGFPYIADVYRTIATGGSAANLTSDIGNAFVFGWR